MRIIILQKELERWVNKSMLAFRGHVNLVSSTMSGSSKPPVTEVPESSIRTRTYQLVVDPVYRLKSQPRGGRDGWIPMSLKPAWFTELISEQSRTHNETLSQETKNNPPYTCTHIPPQRNILKNKINLKEYYKTAF